MPKNVDPNAPVMNPSGGYVLAAAQLGSEIYNTYQTGQNNKKQLAYGREMYERQRADNLAQWHLQNQYNSPLAQMQRFQEAGLNPNLIYGQGNPGNASPIPSTNAPGYNPKAPQLQIAPSIATYFDTRLKTAQYDNLRAQNTVLIADAAQKSANTAKALSSTAFTDFQRRQAERLQDISASTAEANLYKTQVQAQQMENEGIRRDTYADIAVRENVEKILSMRMDRDKVSTEIKRLELGNQIQRFDLQLKEMGLNPSDPTYMRVLTQMVNSFLNGSPFDVTKQFIKKSK